MEGDQEQLLILFRGKKFALPLVRHQTVWDVKSALIEAAVQDHAVHQHSSQLNMTQADVKLLCKGKSLPNDAILDEHLKESVKKSKKTTTFHNLVATGVSPAEASQLQQNHEAALQRQTKARLVKDDLSEEGKQRLRQRDAVGRRIIIRQQQQQVGKSMSPFAHYGFGSIETLTGLPHEPEARRILNALSKDPRILACMAIHQWNVGTLAELYPEGKVGESPVCVMGLNENRGTKILLRLRTDDLAGFRKMLSIRKVLYHELAHNVHSDHGAKFFQLMRQIERECHELDWTQGAGLSQLDDNDVDDESNHRNSSFVYTAGSYRLGGDGDVTSSSHYRRRRELAAAAAELRMTAEEDEIEQNCGCNSTLGRHYDLFLPKPPPPPPPQPQQQDVSPPKEHGSENAFRLQKETNENDTDDGNSMDAS